MDGVACYGIESRLIDCTYEDAQNLQYCSHTEDARLRCTLCEHLLSCMKNIILCYSSSRFSSKFYNAECDSNINNKGLGSSNSFCSTLSCCDTILNHLFSTWKTITLRSDCKQCYNISYYHWLKSLYILLMLCCCREFSWSRSKQLSFFLDK